MVLYLNSTMSDDFIRRYNVSDKTVEMMKKVLANKKLKQAEQPKHRPTNKIGSSATGFTGFNSMKNGGSNNKV